MSLTASPVAHVAWLVISEPVQFPSYINTGDTVRSKLLIA